MIINKVLYYSQSILRISLTNVIVRNYISLIMVFPNYLPLICMRTDGLIVSSLLQPRPLSDSAGI